MEKEPKIKDWSEVTITNQFMFNKVFTSNPEACKRLLEILLGFKISEIKPPQKEVTFEKLNLATRTWRKSKERIFCLPTERKVNLDTSYRDILVGIKITWR